MNNRLICLDLHGVNTGLLQRSSAQEMNVTEPFIGRPSVLQPATLSTLMDFWVVWAKGIFCQIGWSSQC